MNKFLFLPFLFAASIFASPKVEKLTPPKLSTETVGRLSFCDRPMRDGKFNISFEKRGEKNLVHCYGHGGSGGTTSFGSIEQAIMHLENNLSEVERSKPIRIIGAGLIGLTAACELSRKGYTVSKISVEESFKLPSWNAAGYFALVSVKTSPEEQKNLNEIGLKTFQTYQSIDRGEHPYISSDIAEILPVYCSEQTDSGIEDLIARGYLPEREEVILDFGNGVQHPGYYKYQTYFFDITRIMQQLYQEVNRLNIPIVHEKIHAFDDVEESIIFNATGLGAKTLNEDDKMIAVRGHLALLNDKAGTEHMNYMIYTSVEQDGKEESVYMFPKRLDVHTDCVEGVPCHSCLGGTFIRDVDLLTDEERAELDRAEWKKLLDRNSQFFYGKDFQ